MGVEAGTAIRLSDTIAQLFAHAVVRMAMAQSDTAPVAAGMRIGCENLTQLSARGNDESVPGNLDALCATNARHVACNVCEIAHWALLSFSQVTDELLREVEQELDADPADYEPQRKLRK